MAKNGKGKFLLGALIGAGLGILFAPKKGSETRRQLKNKLDEFILKVKDIDIEDVKEELEIKIAELKQELNNLDKETVLEYAKEKGEYLKVKSKEIFDLAKEKGTPILQKAAEELREKTVLVAKEVIKKLEKK